MRSLFSKLRPSSIALAISLLFALGGIYAIDRALADTNRTQVNIQAVESAARVEGFLTVHAQALQSIRGLYLDSTHTVGADQFQALLGSIVQYANAFRHVWVSDSVGHLVFQDQLGSLGSASNTPSLPLGFVTDSILEQPFRIAIQRARATQRTQISSMGKFTRGDRGILLVQPLYVGKRFLGYAGGTLTSSSIVSFLEEQEPKWHGQIVIIAAADTIMGERPQGMQGRLPVDSASASVRIPGGGSWRLIAIQPVTNQSVRFLLWGVGIATLGTLLIGLLHERRQGLRLAERSAELERLSSELLRANRVKSEFLANVSHELRTPLNAIVGFVELLRDGVYGELNGRQSGPVERIASSANHLRQLVDQILDLAKMAAGRLDVQWEIIELQSFVVDLTSEIEALLNERKLALSLSVSSALPRVRTDPMHLRQIMLNLLGNALKFTPTGGIAVRARLYDATDTAIADGSAQQNGIPASGTWIALEVADTGVGIGRNDHQRIFEEFEQVNAGPRTDSVQRGTGLGLPISRRLARLLGGEITLVSEPGKGSTFTVWIPVTGQEKSSGVFSAGRNKQPMTGNTAEYPITF